MMMMIMIVMMMMMRCDHSCLSSFTSHDWSLLPLYLVSIIYPPPSIRFKQISTDEQRQEVVDMANAAEEWLYDEGRGQTIAVYQAKQQEIRSAADLIFKRHSEVAARKEEIAKAQKFSDVVKSKV